MKRLIFLLCGILFSFGAMEAMRSQHSISLRREKYHLKFQQKFKEKQNIIPQLFSFHDIWRGCNALSKKKKMYVSHNIKQSLLFSFAICPKEIRHKILTIMLDNDAQSAYEFDKKPILAAFEHYRYAKEYAPVRISNKEYSAGMLFRYSQEEIDQIRGVYQPFSFIERSMGYEKNIVSEKQLKSIQAMREDITQGLQVKVVRDDYVDGCLFGPVAMCVISGFAYPFLSVPVAAGITCCLEGMFSVLYYRRASLDAIEVEL